MPITAAVARAGAHLRTVQAGAPDLLTGLHLVGSAVLDDYRDGSDLDVVAELSRVPAPADLAALAAAHLADPGVEAVYLATGTLEREVDAAGDGPWGADGELHTGGPCFQLNPVTWLQLRRHAVTVLGTRPRPPVSDARVRAFCVGNLDEYWRPSLERVAEVLGGREPSAPADPAVVEWVTLGPPRLWHTIRTGEVVGKTRAGELAVERWPDLAGPVSEVLAWRRGEPVGLTSRHGLAAVTLCHRILEDCR